MYICLLALRMALFREEDVCKQKQGRQNIMVTMSISWDLSEPKKKKKKKGRDTKEQSGTQLSPALLSG
jgi:hypothetical protein